MIPAASDWTILVPVKSTTRGKSRLDVPVDLRQRLALAMALDTVSAAAACGSVVAVVDDASDAAALTRISGVRAHLTSVSGLNESIRDGLKALSGRGGPATSEGAGGTGGTGKVAVLPGDLPSLQAGELAQVLERCARHRFSVVADHQGVGTTLLAATEPAALEPQYGPDSYRRHRDAGAAAIELPRGSSLRRDVDVVVDLGAVCGVFTREALAAFAPEGPSV